MVGINTHTSLTQVICKLLCSTYCTLAYRCDIKLYRIGLWYLNAVFFKTEQKSFYTKTKSDSRCALTAKLFNEPVITTAAAYGEITAYYLKYRLCIIVKTTHNTAVDCILHAHRIKARLKLLKMLTAIVTDIVKECRCVLYDVLTNLRLTVDNS